MSSVAIAKQMLRDLAVPVAGMGMVLALIFATGNAVTGDNTQAALFLIVMLLWLAFIVVYILARIQMADSGMEVETDG